MFAWMKRRSIALLVSTIMFALMAAVMAEFLIVDDSLFSTIFDRENLSDQGMLWTWRIGGLVTWPVFLWLLLRPYVRKGDSAHQTILVQTLVAIALYGGGGLWLISSVWQGLVLLEDTVLSLLVPFVALIALFLPYAYTWGFVAQYGLARDRLACNSTHGWVSRSLGATILGIYGIGFLIYLALAVVMVPVVAILSTAPDEVSGHVALGLFAIALSTGNFASQWYAFYSVDKWFEEQEQPAYVPTGAPGPAPAGAGYAAPVGTSPVNPTPAGPTTVTNMPDGSVVLPDGRLVTADGRVYVPQDQIPRQAPPAPGAPPAPDGSGDGKPSYDKY